MNKAIRSVLLALILAVPGLAPAAGVAPLNPYNFGAKCDGTTDDTTALTRTFAEMYRVGAPVYFPAMCVVSSTITLGNTVANAAKHVYWYGCGATCGIKSTAASVTPILFQGPSPDVDGAGNRIDGRIVIENMAFLGPGQFSLAKSGTGIKFYGVQGVTFRNVYAKGWDTGAFFQNVDLFTSYSSWYQQNNKGIDTTATGYALAGGGGLNSWMIVGGNIGQNSTFGVNYFGGLAPYFLTNFTVNGTSLILSNTGGSASATESPVVMSYFESDTVNAIKLGGGAGIVRGGVYDGGNILVTASTTAVVVANYSNQFGRGRFNIPMAVSGGVGTFTPMDQSSSAEKLDLYPFSIRSGNAVATPADTTEDTLATITIPANTIGPQGYVKIRTQWSTANNANAKTVRIRYSGGAGTVVEQEALANTTGGVGELTISAQGVTNSQTGSSFFGNSAGTVSVGTGTVTAVDTTAATTIVITGQKGVAGDNLTMQSYRVEVVPGY